MIAFDPQPIEKRLAGMDDFAVILAFRAFSGRLSACEYDPVAALAGFPEKALGIGMDEFTSWLWRDDVADRPCDADTSVHAARTLLSAAARCEGLRSLVDEVLAKPDDERLDAGLVIEFGIVAGTLMMIASTRVDIRMNGLRIQKKPVSAETIRALAELIGLLRKSVVGLGTGPSSTSRTVE
jgi:hypothetical protein